MELLISFGPRIAGAVVLFAAAVKALQPHTFQSHLLSLAVVPPRLVPPTVTIVAAAEAAWGVALVVGAAPAFVLPASIGALLLLSLVSIWGVRSGRAPDCGCYGGFVSPSIRQSVGINLFLALLVGAAWLMLGATGSTGGVLAYPALAGLAFGLLAWKAQEFAMRHGRHLLDLSPLKEGARWKDSWSGGATSGLKDEFIVSLMGTDCEFCEEWVRVANAIVQHPDLPRVVGVVAASREKAQVFALDHGTRFPVGPISPSLMSRLVERFPTCVHVVDGRIARIWSGQVPQDFVARIRSSFFPNGPADAAGRAAGRVNSASLA